MNTVLDYVDRTYEFEGSARVEAATDLGEIQVVELDRTIFYPQGGGQPTDVGEITSDSARFRVDKVTLQDGVVRHSGHFLEGTFAAGDTVTMHVDSSVRLMNSRLHTGGHLVMTAMNELRGLKPAKGYHFPDGPYVEFLGEVQPDERSGLLIEMQTLIDQIVAEDEPVSSMQTTIEDLESSGVYIPSEIPRDKPTRVLETHGYLSPCGGTHVKRTGELEGLRLRNIKSKKDRVRVGYEIP